MNTSNYRSDFRPLLAVVALCALLVTVAYQHSQPYPLELGTVENPLLEGFHAPESTRGGTLRWTSAHATVRLPNLWPAQPVRLRLQLSAPRPDNAPVPVALAVNGLPVATLALTSANASYTFEFTGEQLGPSGNFYLTLTAPPYSPPNDLRALGVLVRALDVTPTGSPPFMPSLPVLLSLCALVGISYVWLRRLGADSHVALAADLLLMVAIFALLWDARALIALLNAQLLFWVVVAYALTELTVRLGGYGAVPRAYGWTSLLFLGAFGIRLLLAHAPGDPDNFTAFKLMIEQATTHGLASIYDLDPVVGAYPPVHHYDMALIGWLYQTFVSPEFDLDSTRLNFMMKMPTIVLDMLIVVALMAYAARRRDARTALLAGAAYAFNPGIVYTTAYNGQLGDPLYTLFTTVAVIALVEEHGALLGAATMLAVLTKPQASAFLPFLALAALRHLRWKSIPRTVAVGGATTAAVLLPFVSAGTLGEMVRTVTTTIGHGPRISSNAFNIWWLVGWGHAWDVKDTETLFGISYRMMGLLLFFGAAYGLVAWKVWTARGARDLINLAAFTGFAFFMLPTEIHENYLFPTIPLLVLLAVHERRGWWLLGILSLSWFVNLISIDPTLMDPLNEVWPAFNALLFPVGVVLASVNVLVLGWWTWRIIRMIEVKGE